MSNRTFSEISQLPRSIFSSITRYTRFVVFTKYGLLILLSGFFGYVIFKANDTNDNNRFNLVFSEVGKSESSTPRMVKPKFQGTDNKGRNYSITGDYAEQVDDKLTRIKNIQGEITLEDDSWLSISADSADVDKIQKSVMLASGVSLYHDKGYEIHGSMIALDLATGIASSQNKVYGQGPMGVFVADSFRIESKTSKLIFTGNVGLKIYAN